jgi:hypothetical protein
MRGALLLAITAFTAILSGDGAAAWAPHVRGLSAPGRELLTDASARSAVVRSLIEALDATNVIVYVTVEPLPGHRTSGYLSFLGAGGGSRYLLVRIDWLAPPRDLVVMLGHELQHALEVAAAPDVQDVLTFTALYRHIGWQSGPGRWETDLARQTGERVLRELSASRPGV